MSNANLPPGCYGGDPRAPWNEPDPWEGMECGACGHMLWAEMLDGSTKAVCAVDDAYLQEVERSQEACELFEGARF